MRIKMILLGSSFLLQFRDIGDRLSYLILLPLLRVLSKGYFFITYPRMIEMQQVQKILIIALNKGIGDAVLYSPALNKLRKEFPKAQITIVVNSYVKELVKRFRSIDKILIYNCQTMKWKEKIRFIRNLRIQRFDLAFDFHWYKFLESAVLAFLSGSKDLVGFNHDFRSLFFNHRYKPDFENSHFADLCLGLVQSIGIKNNGIPSFENIQISEIEKSNCSKLLKDEAIGEQDLIIGVQPGARDAIDVVDKRWSSTGYAHLADYLIEKYQAKILLLGDTSEKNRGEEVTLKMKHSPINFIGRTSIGEVIALLKRLDLLICNNSGLLHLAVALNIPTVSFGGVNVVRWGPFSKNEKHIVSNGEVEEAIRTVDRQLSLIIDFRTKYRTIIHPLSISPRSVAIALVQPSQPLRRSRQRRRPSMGRDNLPAGRKESER